jgi:hypothetical protein
MPFIPLLFIGAAVTGGIMASQAQAQEARNQAAMAKYNQDVMNQQAKTKEQQTAFEQNRQAEESHRQMSSLQANLGMSGAVSTEGSPLMIQAKQASESELENLMIGYEGQNQAQYMRSQAGGYGMQSSIYKSKARNIANAGYMNAGSTLLTGFNDMGWFDKKV